jgi:hypothetical protein
MEDLKEDLKDRAKEIGMIIGIILIIFSVFTLFMGFTDTTKCIQIYTSSKIKNIHINTNI